MELFHNWFDEERDGAGVNLKLYRLGSQFPGGKSKWSEMRFAVLFLKLFPISLLDALWQLTTFQAPSPLQFSFCPFSHDLCSLLSLSEFSDLEFFSFSPLSSCPTIWCTFWHILIPWFPPFQSQQHFKGGIPNFKSPWVFCGKHCLNEEFQPF